jgi:hypothetical protein
MGKTGAQLVLSSADRIKWSVNVLDIEPQPYNDFLANIPGQNIIQGQIKQVEVAEVFFPYDIPNVQAPGDTLQIIGVPGNAVITIATGFYTGTELATAVTQALTNANYVGVTCNYSATNNIFSFVNASANPVTILPNPNLVQNPQILAQKQLLTTMGFKYDLTEATLQINPGATITSDSAPLIWTQYIDICSTNLNRNAFVADGNTNQFVNKKNLVARIYIADEISQINPGGTTGSVAGTRPFIIHRQFKNPKVIAWNADQAVDSVDIQLYDDQGQFLDYLWLPRDFCITFNVIEDTKDARGQTTGQYM